MSHGSWPCCGLSSSYLDKALLVDAIAVVGLDLREDLVDDRSWSSMQLPQAPSTPSLVQRTDGIRSSERRKQPHMAGKTFTVTIHRTALKRKIGLSLAYNVVGDRRMIVKDVQMGLLVHDWNLIHPQKAIQAGDIVVATNGQNHPSRMLQLLEDTDKEIITIVILRSARRGTIFES
mmetsp:Transcript_34527/g.78851  ORF Transcript_34527/g.78851 Transcript_34527/m.78851 type:complete len:176 (-) Transcript_34527:143-670(-)